MSPGRWIVRAGVLAVWLAGGACGGAAPSPRAAPRGEEASMAWTLESPAFGPGAAIPVEHTCDGEDLSPALRWGEPPRGTVAFALICDDPDAPAGTWVHWLLWDVPAQVRELPRGLPPQAVLRNPEGAKQGRNDFRRLGYGGPCPPPGKPHRYFFRLYALDRKLELSGGATRAELERAMAGHVLAQTELMGTYGRRR